uniref:Uncharacterized protein n=1 Tax=Chenopodium quinoa TaxID=63459 RepID=A0A803LM41_CHEQI
MAASSTSPQDPTQDPTSPYFIHPNDSLKMASVPIKFDGTGFNDWKRLMMIGLSAKNKLGFIDGTIDLPNPSDSVYGAWKRCNDLVISWILSALDPMLARSVLYFTTAREIWQNLEESCGGCVCNLTQKLVKQKDSQRLIQFLMKLNDHFAMVRGNILLMQPLVEVNHAYRLLVQEERHKSVVDRMQSGNTVSHAFAAEKRNYGGNRNFEHQANRGYGFQNNQNSSFVKGGFNDRYKGKSVMNSDNRRSQFFCEHCKMVGHTIDRCFKIIDYPQDFKANTKPFNVNGKRFANLAQADEGDGSADVVTVSREQYNQFMEYADKSTTSQLEGFVARDSAPSSYNGINNGSALIAGKICLVSAFFSDWVVDSGATDHMTCDLKYFTSYKVVSPGLHSNTIPDGSKVSVSHIGTVELNGIKLNDVLFVPGFKFNLISVPKLCEDMKCEVVFSANKCFVQDHSMRMHLGDLKEGLYCVPAKVPEESGFLSKLNKVKIANVASASPFPQLRLVDSRINVSNFSHNSFCQVCPMARKHRLSFSSSSIKSTAPFHLLHIDMWGPHRI